MRLHTYYCLVCGKLKQGDVRRIELNVCEDCSPPESEEEVHPHPA